MIAAMSGPSAPPVAGFVESAFNPMVYQAVERCLTARPGDGSRTAMALASTMGDAATLDLGSRLLVAGQVHNPLLFMQSTANAVLGQLSREFAITGPLLCLSTVADPAGELLAAAELLLEDGELDRVVLIGVELTGSERTTAAYRELRTGPPATDLAVAIVLDRGDPVPRPPSDIPPAPSGEYGTLRGLVELAARIQGTTL
ncbi:hypothetical protein [Streptomyces iranensis]|uniref:hypothetical protein n=1 Tax=Streptomyces iranensis TaxID=576784 RepID=UPI0039B76A0F